MARKKRNTDAVETITPVHRPAGDSESAGQSGDLQGLPGDPQAGSESVRELAEEGQAFEASLVDAVENAPPADAGPVKTHEVPEDDVPPEYTDHDPDEPREE